MPTEKPPTYEPNMEALTQRLRGNDIMSHEEFIKLVSPKTFEGLTKADAGDKFLDMIGVPTERIDRLKEAKKVEDNLTPAYHAYVQKHLQHLTEGSTYGQAKTMYPDLPWEKGQPGNPLTPGNTPSQGPQAGAPPTSGSLLPQVPPPPGIISSSPGMAQQSMLGPGPAQPMPQAIPNDIQQQGTSYMHRDPRTGQVVDPQSFATPPIPPGQGVQYPSLGDTLQQPEGLLPPGPQVAQSSPGQPISQVSPQAVGNENDLLPRPYQKYVDMRQHREGMRALLGRTGGTGSAQSQILNHYQGLATGEIPEAYDGETDFYKGLLTQSKTAAPGSLEGLNKQADLDKKNALLPTVGDQAKATLEKTKAGTEHTQAQTETENKLRDAKLENLEAGIKLKLRQAELAHDESGMIKMRQKGLMVQIYKIGNAQGLFNEEDDKAILNYLAPEGMEFRGTPPGAFKQFLDKMGFPVDMGDTGIHVAPKGTQAPAGGKADFSDAPPGKKQGQVLNQNGKPVATWSGKAWVPISTK